MNLTRPLSPLQAAKKAGKSAAVNGTAEALPAAAAPPAVAEKSSSSSPSDGAAADGGGKAAVAAAAAQLAAAHSTAKKAAAQKWPKRDFDVGIISALPCSFSHNPVLAFPCWEMLPRPAELHFILFVQTAC